MQYNPGYTYSNAAFQDRLPRAQGSQRACRNVAFLKPLDRKIPAFTMEMRVDFNQKLGRPPTWKDRVEYGAEIVQAMVLVVTGK